jgi:hypothetical protein
VRIVPILFYKSARCSGSSTAINLIEIIKEFLRKISRKTSRKISRKISKIKIRIISIIFLKLFSENNPSIFYKIKWILLNRIDPILNFTDIKNWFTR